MNLLTDLLSSSGLRHSQTDSQDRVGSEIGLVLRTIKLIEELVNFILIFDIDVFLDQGGANGRVNIVYGLGDA